MPIKYENYIRSARTSRLWSENASWKCSCGAFFPVTPPTWKAWHWNGMLPTDGTHRKWSCRYLCILMSELQPSTQTSSWEDFSFLEIFQLFFLKRVLASYPRGWVNVWPGSVCPAVAIQTRHCLFPKMAGHIHYQAASYSIFSSILGAQRNPCVCSVQTLPINSYYHSRKHYTCVLLWSNTSNTFMDTHHSSFPSVTMQKF